MSGRRTPREPVNTVIAPVRVSVALSCGCTTRPRGGLTNLEATMPGVAVICDAHDEFAVVTRVTRYLDVDQAGFRDLLSAMVDDPDVRDSVAGHQWRADR